MSGLNRTRNQRRKGRGTLVDRAFDRKVESHAFLEGLLRYAEKDVVRFHTPGHRGGRWMDFSLRDADRRGMFSLDTSDVLEGSRPTEDWTTALVSAQNRVRSILEAGATRFLVNGTSGGIHAAIFALGVGRSAVVARASHTSVYAGLIFARTQPVFVPPIYDGEWDISGPPALSSWLDATRQAEPDLVIVTYPDYYGLAMDLSAFVDQVNPIPVIVDEAHGAHFPFAPDSPLPALACGSAITIQSSHKSMGALTQASMLHVHSEALSILPMVDTAINLFQTTSPSPLLLASLEAGIHPDSKRDWVKAISLAASLIEEIPYRTELRCLTADIAWKRWSARLDPSRVVVNVGDAGWNGWEAATWLRKERGIQVELANQRCVVALVSPGNDERDAKRLVESLVDLVQTEPPSPLHILEPPFDVPARLPMWEAIGREREFVPFDECQGRIASELICPYPPGIPVVAPGEEITQEVAEYLAHVRNFGWDVRGPADPTLAVVGVVR